ncbi:MAG: hypothetical protein HC772_16580 [Leptolyngbyaceae cyanobacterium CRU_2_3]|nr:hypothetical protein [Leptolyngbyaceae cyanobacterium CRU_2_3]
MMQVLIVCIVLFFGAAELYQWMQGMALPLPVLVAAGVVLAIASNASHPTFQSWQSFRQHPSGASLTALSARPASAVSQAIPVAPSFPSSEPFSHLDPQAQEQAQAQSISFTIRKVGDRQEHQAEDLD